MKRVIAIAAAIVVLVAGVAYAADASPTLADVYKAITDLRADVAQLKADGFTKANVSNVASVSTNDGLVTLTVTSVMAGPDATVIGLTVTNKTTEKDVDLNTLMGTSLVAGGKQIKLLEDNGFTGGALPGTFQHGVLLFEPLPQDVKEIVLRTALYDDRSFSKVLEPTITISLNK